MEISQIPAQSEPVKRTLSLPSALSWGDQWGSLPFEQGSLMGRGLHILTARAVATLTSVGRHADGGGLYLHVRDRSGRVERLWVFRYKRGERGLEAEKTLSLGPARDVSLADARTLASRCRAALARGANPRDEIAKGGGVPSFGEVADALIAALEPGFKSAKHAAQWRMTLGDTYCRKLRPIPVNQVRTEEVLAVLKPVWQAKPETASRIRGRIERVLDSATAQKLRVGDNPARWRGHLNHLLSAQSDMVRGHHAALAWSELPDFMNRLHGLNSISALALEWTILTAARTSETVGAPRSEVDRKARVWTVPAVRMKAERSHRVPLCDRCLWIFDELEKTSSAWLFPGQSLDRHLSLAAMAECLKGFELVATVHGFRSSFRDWAGEATSFSENLAEAALAHVIGDKTERAYRRGDALERRRGLMMAWERYCLGDVGKVVSLAGRKRE